ncbi:MAG: sporulation protein YtfJ [Clostridia bacterium]|nr:sporulation protein YtfJ [Clostridia bacterium]
MNKQNGAAGILSSTIEKVRDLVDVSTIIGDPIEAGGITIIPVSKVTYGFASGGSDFPSKSNAEIFGGGGGAGITITPVAFLIIKNGDVTIKYVNASEGGQAERIIGMVPDVIDKLSGAVEKFTKKGDPVSEADAIIDAADAVTE